jgi:hypothetical protein
MMTCIGVVRFIVGVVVVLGVALAFGIVGATLGAALGLGTLLSRLLAMLIDLFQELWESWGFHPIGFCLLFVGLEPSRLVVTFAIVMFIVPTLGWMPGGPFACILLVFPAVIV